MKDNNLTKKKNFIYLAIGIFTLIIAVTGATYAYFTASDTKTNVMTGNMASITFNISVEKKSNVDNTRGLIPMTNSMVEKAASADYGDGICLDDNNNAVCQIYKIVINNSSTASMFFDGYVTLTGGSGNPTDVSTWNNVGSSATKTTMRWAQAFCTESSGALSTCTTAGSATVHQTNTISWDALSIGTGHYTDAIKTAINDVSADGTNSTTGATIQGNTYRAINKNYIRISDHANGAGYKQATDVTSALVYNQYLSPNDNVDSNNTGDSSSTYTDSQVYYIVVWLSETGTNQTAGSTGAGAATATANFFQGVVTFMSAQGSEVTAMFGDYIAVTPDTVS